MCIDANTPNQLKAEVAAAAVLDQIHIRSQNTRVTLSGPLNSSAEAARGESCRVTTREGRKDQCRKALAVGPTVPPR